MKLHYYRDEVGNFGDDLNPWLWRQLMPQIFDDDPDELFVGIGTLLNHRLPAKPVKHIFGSGYGYGSAPATDRTFLFHAVRGPRTANLLRLDKRLAITDPAILVRHCIEQVGKPEKQRTGFIPHYQSTRFFPWESLCTELNLHFISVEWPVDRVLSEMQSCETVLCEAMHGAIVADALRIPWTPVRCYEYILTFKWLDWLDSLALEYKPSKICSLFDAERSLGWRARRKNSVKRLLRASGLWSEQWYAPPPRKTSERDREQASLDLMRAQARDPILSPDHLCEELTQRYLELVESFVSKYRTT